MPVDPWQQFASLRLVLVNQFTHPSKKVLLMGHLIDWESPRR